MMARFSYPLIRQFSYSFLILKALFPHRLTSVIMSAESGVCAAVIGSDRVFLVEICLALHVD